MLETIAEADYDDLVIDAGRNRIGRKRFHEVRELAFSLVLKVPTLLGDVLP